MDIYQRSVRNNQALRKDPLLLQRISLAYIAMDRMKFELDDPQPQSPVTVLGQGKSNIVFNLEHTVNSIPLALRIPRRPDYYFNRCQSMLDISSFEDAQDRYKTTRILVPIKGLVRNSVHYGILLENLAKNAEFKDDPYDHRFAYRNNEKCFIDPEYCAYMTENDYSKLMISVM